MVAVEDAVVAEGTKVVVATEAVATTTTATATASTIEIKVAASTTIKSLPINQDGGGYQGNNNKGPPHGQGEKGSIFIQEGGIISTILKRALELQGIPTK